MFYVSPGISPVYTFTTSLLSPYSQSSKSKNRQEAAVLPVVLSGFHNIMSLGDRCCRPAYKLSHDLSVLWCRRINSSAVASLSLIHSLRQERSTGCPLIKKRKMQSSFWRTFCVTLLFTISLPLFLRFSFDCETTIKDRERERESLLQ